MGAGHHHDHGHVPRNLAHEGPLWWALGLTGGQWLDEDVAAPELTMYASQPATPAGVEASASTASPE